MIEAAPPYPVSDKAHLENSQRIVKNALAFLGQVAVRVSDAGALLEVVQWLSTMEARLGEDIAKAE